MTTARFATIAFAALALGACSGSDDAPPTHGGSTNQGTRFRDYLRAAPYPKLVLEIDSVDGTAPANAVTGDITAILRNILAKPGGIAVVHDGTLPSRGHDHAWTFEELDELARSTFDLSVGGDTTKMHLLYVDGHSAEDTSAGQVLGLAWAHTHLVMFRDTIRANCEGHPSPVRRERLCQGSETAVLTHEIGHLLGLVDNGLPMTSNHRDPDPAHGRHDANEDCVMYWAHDGSGAVKSIAKRLSLGDETAMGFDAACLADLRAVREGN